MALIKDKQIILDKMRSAKMQYYRVKDSDSKSLIDSNEDPELGLDAAIQALETTLNNCDGLVYVSIMARNSKAKAEGGDTTKSFNYTIKLGTGSSTSAIGAIGGNNYLETIMTLMNNNFTVQMQMMQKSFEHERELEKAKKESEKEVHPLLLKAVNKLERMIPDHTPGNIHAPAIHGLPEGQKKQFIQKPMTEEEKKKLNLAIAILIQEDADFLEHITMLATMVQNDPEMYAMAIKKLKQLSS